MADLTRRLEQKELEKALLEQTRDEEIKTLLSQVAMLQQLNKTQLATMTGIGERTSSRAAHRIEFSSRSPQRSTSTPPSSSPHRPSKPADKDTDSERGGRAPESPGASVPGTHAMTRRTDLLSGSPARQSKGERRADHKIEYSSRSPSPAARQQQYAIACGSPASVFAFRKVKHTRTRMRA